MRGTTIIAASAIAPLCLTSSRACHVVAAALGSLVVVSVCLESMLRLRDRWRNYRSTEQYLGMEEYYYRTSSGPYRTLSHAEAGRRLVERVERAISLENGATLDSMTLGPEPLIHDRLT
jgi:hypothetical protein